MKLYLLFILLLLTTRSLYAQEIKPTTSNIKKVELRSNSREQAIVKRDNFHQRWDMRTFQMNRQMRMPKRKRDTQKKTLQMQKKNRMKLQAKQKKLIMQRQRQQAIRKNTKR